MEWVPCECNSSYSFRLILLKLYTYFSVGLKMCMWFFQYPETIFFTYFGIFNLDFFFFTSNIVKVHMDQVPCECNFSNSFMLTLLKLNACFNVGLKKDVHVVHPHPQDILFLPQSVHVSLNLAIHLNPGKGGWGEGGRRQLFSFKNKFQFFQHRKK